MFLKIYLGFYHQAKQKESYRNNRGGKNFIKYIHTQVTYVLKLSTDVGKQKLKILSTEFSQQLSSEQVIFSSSYTPIWVENRYWP